MAAAAVFDALGNAHRRTIVALLAAGPRPVNDIARQLPVSRPAVSKHLRILEDAGLVSFVRDGNRHLFALDRSGFELARGWIDQFWLEALGRFAAVAEGPDPSEGAR
ncbi:MAG: metalloregulator ArsR/SmtB family transcription factor [Myxococcota bacterium]